MKKINIKLAFTGHEPLVLKKYALHKVAAFRSDFFNIIGPTNIPTPEGIGAHDDVLDRHFENYRNDSNTTISVIVVNNYIEGGWFARPNDDRNVVLVSGPECLDYAQKHHIEVSDFILRSIYGARVLYHVYSEAPGYLNSLQTIRQSSIGGLLDISMIKDDSALFFDNPTLGNAGYHAFFENHVPNFTSTERSTVEKELRRLRRSLINSVRRKMDADPFYVLILSCGLSALLSLIISLLFTIKF